MSCDASRDKVARAAQASGTSRLVSKAAGLAVDQRPGCVRKVGDVDWARRTVIGAGGFALVYRVAPEVVAKVGDIQPAEAEVQRHFARQGLALPVLDYQEEVELPAEVSREACPVHGKRVDILPEEGYACTCGQPVAVLLMPLAEDVEGVSHDELYAFMMGFSRDCEEQLGLYWDARPLNVARYNGRLVALDFGEER